MNEGAKNLLDELEEALIGELTPEERERGCALIESHLTTAWGAGRRDALRWIPVDERMPASNLPVLALVTVNGVRGIAARRLRLRARYIAKFTLPVDSDSVDWGEYNEEDNIYYNEEGWYETNEFEEVHWPIYGLVTAWMPLPPY